MYRFALIKMLRTCFPRTIFYVRFIFHRFYLLRHSYKLLSHAIKPRRINNIVKNFLNSSPPPKTLSARLSLRSLSVRVFPLCFCSVRLLLTIFHSRHFALFAVFFLAASVNKFIVPAEYASFSLTDARPKCK